MSTFYSKATFIKEIYYFYKIIKLLFESIPYIFKIFHSNVLVVNKDVTLALILRFLSKG